MAIGLYCTGVTLVADETRNGPLCDRQYDASLIPFAAQAFYRYKRVSCPGFAPCTSCFTHRHGDRDYLGDMYLEQDNYLDIVILLAR